MKKIVVSFILFFIFIIPIKAIEINSNHAILYNLNDDMIIYEKDANSKVSIASITKIVTAIITLENSNLSDTVIIPNKAFYGLDGYALAGFKVGDKVTIEDLLYGLMLPSGAECGNTLALTITDSKENFVKLMNDLVQKLNLSNTHFDNPIGMDSKDNYSTAYDIAQILKYALKNADFKKIFTSNSYTASNGVKLEKTLDKYAKRDKLDISIIDGAKTGNTDLAGYCLASTSSLNGVDYLLVTLGSNNSRDYIMDANNIYNYYNDNYSYKFILTDNQYLTSIPIKNGVNKELNVYSNDYIYKYLNNEISITDLNYEYEGIEYIDKSIKLNDKLGTIKIIYNDEVLTTYDIYLTEEIKYKNNIWKIVLISLIGLIFILLIKKKRKKKLNRKKIQNRRK